MMVKKPAIRFKQFENDWEEKDFMRVFSFLQNNTLSRNELSDEEGSAINIHYGDVLVKYGDYTDLRNVDCQYIQDENIVEKFKNSLLKDGDVIVADTAEDETVGKCCEITGLEKRKAIAGLHTMPLRPNIKFAASFLGYYMNSDAYHRQLLPLMQGTKVTSISKSAIQGTKLVFPKELDEQKAIGDFFICLDNLLEYHGRKYVKAQNVKRAMLEKLIIHNDTDAPEIRFGEYKQSWEKVSLGDVVMPYSDPVETPHDGYLRLGIRSYGKGTFHDTVKAGQELGTAQMHRVAANKLIVNITFAWEHAVAITGEEDEGKLVSHRFPQFSMTEKIDAQFLKYVILDERFRHHLLLSSPGGAGRNRVLKVDEMLEYSFRIPQIEEQREIAGFLNSLDDLIKLYDMRIERLKHIKTACLDGMFM